jgi:hypothetical protein
MDIMWPTPTELNYLNDLFGFVATGDEQDWEIEFADASRTEEFFSFYESEELTQGQKMALMQLVLASFDEILYSKTDDINLWKRISEKLKQDVSIHKDTIEYWCCKGESHEDNLFPLTLRVREVANAL